ncbi:MAG: hypothetical protein MUE60_08470 [Candidatus Eisenbacteria bacterium]|nr:hypothetical protein [Candidatus Eisenbacteria bacterium]
MKPWHLVHLQRMLRDQWKSPEELADIQNAKLRQLIRHAHARVPVYRRLFDEAGIRPSDIQTVDDLPRIPIMSRRTLHESPLEDRLARGVEPDRCRQSATSGTTGIPLKLHVTPRDATLKSLTWARAFLSRGMRPWDRMVAFIGQEHVRTASSWYERVGLWRRREVSTWAGPEAWVHEIRQWRPRALVGYVMTLRLLADHLLRAGIDDVTPSLVFHSSAVLDDVSRRFLEGTLRTRIVDIYGSDEAGCIAWECGACRGYHVSSDVLVVELLRNGNRVSPGEEGEVIITNLHAYAMPFIRYAQGDVARMSTEPSACGRGLPLLERIEGRTDDFLVLRGGKMISPHPVYHCIDHVPGIARWKAVQHAVDQLTVYIELERRHEPAAIHGAVRRNLQALLGPEVALTVETVECLPVDPSAKFRVVTSTVGAVLT